MTKFVGREKELSKLKSLSNQGVAKLVVVKGRRRIGKTRLLQEFGKKFKKVYTFTGLAPDVGITEKDQREAFANQLAINFGLRGIKADDWSDLFWHLAMQTQEGETLIILDELSWMGEGDKTFLAKFKVAWEQYFKTNTKLIIAMCSSISIWIDQNLLSSTGFVGRLSLVLTLEELELKDCMQFWAGIGSQVSPHEKLLMLSVTGGIPRYLEEINPHQSALDNIKRLCFSKEGVLFHEFNQIFSDLFCKKQVTYQKICEFLANGRAEAKEIFKALTLKGGGDDYQYLETLTVSGFIEKDYNWSFNDGKLSKIASYRLSDNYCRFYLKYIYPNRHKIIQGNFDSASLTALSGWSAIAGLQVENLILNNRSLIRDELGISLSELVYDSAYLVRATKQQKGCQIDYLIQTKFKTLYVCEVKYSKNIISAKVISEVKEKIRRLKPGKNFSIRPVLIHCSDVSETIEESGFFAKIINFNEFLR